MEMDRTLGDSSNALAPIVLAIGLPSFPNVLIDTVRTVANVGHCMVFAFDNGHAVRCALGVGNIEIGADLGAAYSEHFHTADPNRETMLEHRSAPSPIVLPRFARRMYSDGYRKVFFEDARIIDKIATAIWVDSICFYVNFYRTVEQGRFARNEAGRLFNIAPAMTAIVARHCQEEDVADTPTKLHTLFATREPFVRLTTRAKEVCLRILS